MLQSKRNQPCFYLQRRADVTELMEIRRPLSKRAQVKITTNDFFVRALALAAQEYPLMAARLSDDRILLPQDINVGFAVSAGGDLMVPVIQRAQRKPLPQIAAESAGLIRKARSSRLNPDAVTGANITLSNLGVFGLESFIAVAAPNQCAVLAVGNIIETCAPGPDGGIRVRKMMAMDLSCDHRIVNGAYAARFLDFLAAMLEQPATLAE